MPSHIPNTLNVNSINRKIGIYLRVWLVVLVARSYIDPDKIKQPINGIKDLLEGLAQGCCSQNSSHTLRWGGNQAQRFPQYEDKIAKI